MKRSLLLAAMLVVSLAVCGSSYAQGTAYFWAGGSFEGEVWHDTVVVTPDQWVDIPIYHLSDIDVNIWSMDYVFGCKQELLDTIDVAGGQVFWPLTEWDLALFPTGSYNYDDHPMYPNAPGYISFSFIGFDMDSPLLHVEIPTKIMSFRVHAANNGGLIGTTRCDALITGWAPQAYCSNCGDSTGTVSYPMDTSFACVRFIEGYQYLPGDVNMYHGQWPPQAIGADVTYLVNFFRGAATSHSCLLDGFWAAADMNGDCNIIGSDVTYRVNVAHGIGRIKYCQDYPPAWLTPADLPEEMPLGWPNCD